MVNEMTPGQRRRAQERRVALTRMGCATYERRPFGGVESMGSMICMCCGIITHNPNDIAHLYCGFCHEYHTEEKRTDTRFEKDDVVQLLPGVGVRDAFVGKLAFVDDVKSWGAQVRVETFEGDAYYRATWDQMGYVGTPPLVRVADADPALARHLVSPPDGHLLTIAIGALTEEHHEQAGTVGLGQSTAGENPERTFDGSAPGGDAACGRGSEGAGEQPPSTT